MARAFEALKLCWFDPKLPPRLRFNKAWRRTLDELRDAFDDAEDEEDDDGPSEEELDVIGLLASETAIDAAEIVDAMAAGARPNGAFAAPLVVVGGELAIGLDELETLRATTSACATLVEGDPQLAAQVEAATALLSTRGASSATGCDVVTARLREAFSQRRSAFTASLDQATERALLEARAFQTRSLLGGPHVRALLTLPGAPEPVPTYLGAAAAEALPLFSRLRIKAICELHPRLDAAEAHAAALSVAAFARALPFGAARS